MSIHSSLICSQFVHFLLEVWCMTMISLYDAGKCGKFEEITLCVNRIIRQLMFVLKRGSLKDDIHKCMKFAFVILNELTWKCNGIRYTVRENVKQFRKAERPIQNSERNVVLHWLKVLQIYIAKTNKSKALNDIYEYTL